MGIIDTKTVLFSSFRLANDCMANNSMPFPASDGEHRIGETIGIDYLTPEAFVESLWDIWGDGRKPVTDTERLFWILGLLEKHGLNFSFGTAKQISELIRRGYTKLIPMNNSLKERFSETEKSVADLVEDYSTILKNHGRVELTELLDMIRPHIHFEDVVLAESCILDEPFSSFFEDCKPFTKAEDGYRDAQDCYPIDVSIIRAEGTSVVDMAIFEECESALNEKCLKKVAIVCKSPDEKFQSLSAQLCTLGAKCTKMGSTGFKDTIFGKFFLATCRLLAMAGSYGLDKVLETDSSDWISVATDISLSPYSSIAPFETSCLSAKTAKRVPDKIGARYLNTVWRNDRTLTAKSAVNDLHAVSPSFQRIESLFSLEGEPIPAISHLERKALSVFGAESSTSEIEAIRSLIALIETAIDCGVPLFFVPVIAQYLCVGNTLSVKPSDEGCDNADPLPEIVFISGSAARSMPEKSFDIVILSDVSDSFLNARSSVVSTLALSEKLGVDMSDESMAKSRLSFASSVKAAKERFACIFPAHDENSEEAFTSFCFDEFIDGLFDGRMKSKDLLSLELDEFGKAEISDGCSLKVLGEETVQRGLGQSLLKVEGFKGVKKAYRGRLSNTNLLDRSTHAQDESGAPRAVISPSAIERYLECPYKWFVDYMISPDTLDEGFSALERGNMAHECLRLFHEKVDEWMPLDGDAGGKPLEDLFTSLFSDLLDDQIRLLPMSGRYVPIGALEQKEANELKDKMLDCMKGLLALPKPFKIAASEYRISPFGDDPKIVDYAGYIINGKTDRIDADPESDRFLIIDYKGSIKGHDAGSACFSKIVDDGETRFDPNILPEHVQTLIYSSVVKELKAFGDSCKGAFYVSYMPKPGDALLAGSCDSSCEHLVKLTDRKSVVDIPFDVFLDLVEEACETRLKAMGDNDISIEPSRKDVCKYCVYSFCFRRRS